MILGSCGIATPGSAISLFFYRSIAYRCYLLAEPTLDTEFYKVVGYKVNNAKINLVCIY